VEDPTDGVRGGMRAISRPRGVAILSALVIVSSLFPVPSSATQRLDAAQSPEPPEPATPLTLIVGQVGQMITRNPLPAMANDVPTSAVLYRVYDTIVLNHPITAEVTPYIVKGVDYNEDGIFETSEYGVFAEQPAAMTPLEVALYYDFNGVRWHDGVQMTPWDLFFSYHVNAMNPRFNTDLRVLFCAPFATYESCGRQLGVAPVTKNWQGEGLMAGDPALRVAVKLTLNEPFAPFYEATIAPVMLPMHVWSRTGGGRHADFGCAIWIPPMEAAARGIPECGNPNPARWGTGIASTDVVPGSSPYLYPNAEAWNPTDADVIGHGPFRFVSWIFGVETQLARNDDFFTGVDPQTGTVFDPRLTTVLKKPTTDGIRFLAYASADLCANALNISAVDFCHANLPPAVIPALRSNPAVAMELNPEPGFFYVGYNMRKAPFGYLLNDSANDVGYWFRQAAAHLANKTYLVDVLLRGFAIVGHGFVSPANTFWYNDNIPKPAYNLTEAANLLDSPEAGAAGIGPDPPGACSPSTPNGCRQLPGIGNASFEILTPNMTYDPVRATAGAMIAASMRAVGLNANATELPFPTLVSRINQPDFDMYILGWRIGGTDPDYLFSFFHSSNEAPVGQNYPGFRNATFDAVIDASRAEMDRATRQSLIFQAQQILSDARPYEVLYYRTNVEAYRRDRWVNWSVQSGTIWNYWSLLGIRPPFGYNITVDTSPAGLQVFVDGSPYAAPYTFPCSLGDTSTIGVPSPQGVGQTRFSFASWSDAGAQTHVIGCAANATYVATFRAEYEITVDSSPPGIPLRVDNVSVTPPYLFWCEDGSAHLVEAPDPITIPETIIRFQYWSDFMPRAHSIGCGGPASYVAYYLVEHMVVLDTAPSGLQLLVNGNVVSTPQATWCPETDHWTLEAPTPQVVGAVRYVFASWSDGGNRTHSVVCARPATYVATYSADAYRITLDTLPSGLQVEVDGSAYAVPYAFWCSAGNTATLGVLSPQGSGATRYVFAGWSDGGTQTHTIACSAPATLTANFATEYQVTLDTWPTGWVVEFDGAPATAPATFWCSAGTTPGVAAPSPQTFGGTRATFVSWSDGGAQSHAIACIGPTAIAGMFSREFEATIRTVPDGLAVEVEGSPHTAPYPLWCAEGGSVTVSASSPQGTGDRRHVFVSWSDGGGSAHAISCVGPLQLTATFALQFRISLGTAPTGLQFLVDGAVVTAPHERWCTDGATLSVEAPASQILEGREYRFENWSDGGARARNVTCNGALAANASYAVQTPGGAPLDPLWIGWGVAAVLAVLVVGTLLWRRSRKRKDAAPRR